MKRDTKKGKTDLQSDAIWGSDSVRSEHLEWVKKKKMCTWSAGVEKKSLERVPVRAVNPVVTRPFINVECHQSP